MKTNRYYIISMMIYLPFNNAMKGLVFPNGELIANPFQLSHILIGGKDLLLMKFGVVMQGRGGRD